MAPDPMAPAERFDVIIDFSRDPLGSEITLVNVLGSGAARAIMRFRVTRTDRDDTTIPDKLTEFDTMNRAQVEGTRDFLFQNLGDSWTINGLQFDPMKPVATPRLGDVEIWRSVTDFHHSVHIHLVQYHVLTRNGDPPGPYDVGWKDTIDLRPAEEASVLVHSPTTRVAT